MAFPRSPYDTVNGLVYFARMLDKIRLFASGNLPEDFTPHLGEGFDRRCLNLLQVAYAPLRERVLAGGTDEEMLEWCFQHGRRLTDEEIETWSDFMRKRGWRDEGYERVVIRMKEAGLEYTSGQVVTMFDFLDLDEGRTPPDFSRWEPKRN